MTQPYGGRTVKSDSRADSHESDNGVRVDAIGNASIGDKGGSPREKFVSLPKSGRNHSNSCSRHQEETEISPPTTVKLQPKTAGLMPQLDSNRTPKKTENFANVVKDYEAVTRTYMISWKSDSLKKRYEKVVG